MKQEIRLQSLKVNEIFYSLQGEGLRQGEPSIFIRLAGCNLHCYFCDTEFETYRILTLDEILNQIKLYKSKWIIWTGGEPTLQLSDEIVAYFKNYNYYQAIETNGTNRVPDGIDYICISPKVALHVLEKNFKNRIIDEIRLPFDLNNSKYSPEQLKQYITLLEQKLQVKRIVISPLFAGDVISNENLKSAIEFCLENNLRFSIQIHKLINIR